MNIPSPNTQQSSLAPLYPQTQQEMRSQAQNEAVVANPVEEAAETSNEQPQPRSDDGRPNAQGRIDAYA